MSTISSIIQQLKEVQEGEAWHGPSVREAIGGVDAPGAAKHPIAGAHSIWEIVHHIRVAEENVCRALTSQPASDEADWPTLTDTGEQAWKATQAALAKSQQALREAAGKIGDAQLLDTVPGKSSSYHYLLLAIMHHDLYHAGQISLLKKGL